jgi:hypothetical protein
MLGALCRQSSTTLDIVHAEDGPPITQRTVGSSQSLAETIATMSFCPGLGLPRTATAARRLNRSRASLPRA